MEIKRHIYRLFCAGLLLMSGLLTGCRSVKELPGTPPSELKAETEFFQSIEEQTIKYQTLSAKMQIEITPVSGKQMSSRAQLKIRKDERLQISIQPLLGIEMFRIELSRDSLKIIDRMNKRFFADDYNKLKEQDAFDFNFYNLQSLLTNQLFLPGETSVSTNNRSRFNWAQNPDGYSLSTTDHSGVNYLFTANHDVKLYSTKISDKEQNTLQWSYANFRTVNNYLFPMNMEATLHNNKLILNYTKVDTDVPVEMNFQIPDNYEQVTLSQIMKMLKQ